MTPAPFKRSDKPGASYYVAFTVANRAYLWSTKTDDLSLAKKRGKAYRDAIVAGAYGLAEGMKQGGGVPTIGELIAAYRDLPTPPLHTREANINALRQLMAVSRLADADRITRLTASVIGDYQRHCQKARPGCMSAIVTCNSVIRKARSLLSRRAMQYYQGQPHCPPPDVVKAFMEVGKLKEPKGAIVLPSDEAQAKAKELTGAYRRIWILARYAGLRSGEIVEARRSWLNGNLLTVAPNPNEYVAKGGRSRRIVLPVEAVNELLLSDDPVYLVGANRKEDVVRKMPAVLRSMGFPARNPLHSVRRLFGSIIFTTQGGAQAQSALGHSSIATTEYYYATNMNAPQPVRWTG